MAIDAFSYIYSNLKGHLFAVHKSLGIVWKMPVQCQFFQEKFSTHRAELALFAVVDDKDAAAAAAFGPELVLTVGSVMEDDTAAEMECHC